MQAQARLYPETTPEQALTYAGIGFGEGPSRRTKTTDVAMLVSVDVVDVTVLWNIST
jgi:hypothetical protein